MKNIVSFCIGIMWLASCKNDPATDIKLADIYGPNMILQRDKIIVIPASPFKINLATEK
ncbi:MAG: hypothetical protein ACLFUC_09065 [Bacteroidales bacterium]